MINDPNHPTGFVKMTNAEYHASPGVSCSHLKAMAQGHRHYWNEYRNPDRPSEEESQEAARTKRALILGSAIHGATLERSSWEREFVVLPPLNLRTNAGRSERDAIVEANPGCHVITEQERDWSFGAAAAVMADPIAGRLLRLCTRREESYFARRRVMHSDGRETEVLVKCRIDAGSPDFRYILDVKSCIAASKGAFRRDVQKYRYDLQSPWYTDVINESCGKTPENFIFIAVESKPPHAVGVYYSLSEDIELSRLDCDSLLTKLIDADREDFWPNPTFDPVEGRYRAQPLELSPYFRRDM